IWDAESAIEVIGEPFNSHSNWVRRKSVPFSPNEKHIVSASSDQPLRLSPSVSTRKHINMVTSRKQIVSTLRLWDAKSANFASRTFKGHSDMVNSVAFSPERKRIASWWNDHSV
ncbi:hypothetical protein C8R43DRAFT_851329, partial [Mycena crocata]